MKRIPVLTVLTALVALWTIAVTFIPSVALAAVPNLINFQGQLKDGSGNPVADGSHTMVVKIYDAASGPNPPLWSDTFTVATSGGLFNLVLGSGAPLPASLFSNSNLWVGVAVDTDPEATPRTQLTSVPYSARVGTVDGATGGVISGNVSIQSELNVSGSLTVQPSSAETPLSIQGSLGQSANLVEIKDDLGAILGSVDSKGKLFHRYGIFAHSVSCGETLSVDQLIATPAIQLKSFSPTDNTISNFPNPVPIKIETSKGSMYIGRSDGVLQQISMDPAASVSKLTEWKNGAGTPVASIDPAGNMTLDGDMDGLNSTWETVGAIDINCNGSLNVNGPAVVQGDAGQTANLQEWRIPIVGGGYDTAVAVDANGNVGIGVAAPHSSLQVDGSVALAIRGFNADEGCLGLPFKITAKNTVIVVGGSIFFGCEACGAELPSAVGIKGRVYTIKNFPSSGCFGAEPITTVGGETIDGDPSYLLQPKKYVTVISDGANWLIIGSN